MSSEGTALVIFLFCFEVCCGGDGGKHCFKRFVMFGENDFIVCLTCTVKSSALISEDFTVWVKFV